ncbi:hypothetical protein CAXC1_20020 [Candidatus Xenohaliotis californiensis]|uniref:Uncharacterized protein n=1 Tax=Candidatus Xenohaliotis californiensis TaxID=84677 RepID=A0ABP0EW43_9RICK|nr:hypothetical protein CAXC1_20020 [Candidatus Xenohaliotis californiensis]
MLFVAMYCVLNVAMIISIENVIKQIDIFEPYGLTTSPKIIIAIKYNMIVLFGSVGSVKYVHAPAAIDIAIKGIVLLYFDFVVVYKFCIIVSCLFLKGNYIE